MAKQRTKPKKIENQPEENKADNILENKTDNTDTDKKANNVVTQIVTPNIDLSFNKTHQRLSLKKTLSYNKILEYVVDSFSKWPVTGRGTYYLEAAGHTMEYDGYSLPVIDGSFLLSDILNEKMPEETVSWLEGLDR